MSGLATLAWMERARLEVLAAPPLEHDLQPTIFNGLACFENGVMTTVERVGGFVRLTTATEAGAIIVSDLSAQDAATLGLLLLGAPPGAALGKP